VRVAAWGQALDVGPLGWECGALLQTEAGRRELQPMLVEAAQRGLLFPDPHGAVQKQRGPDTVRRERESGGQANATLSFHLGACMTKHG
jgi:hypothetical protein